MFRYADSSYSYYTSDHPSHTLLDTSSSLRQELMLMLINHVEAVKGCTRRLHQAVPGVQALARNAGAETRHEQFLVLTDENSSK